MRIYDEDTAFSVTYQWTGDASTVKGFPYVKADPSRLPVQLWNVSSLEFAAKWQTYVKDTQNWSDEEQAVAMDNTGLRVNTAVDMFLSDNAENSTGLGPPIEIMIWQWFTPSVLPLGHSESTPEKDTIEVSGTNYSLYHGWNAQGQNVFSWLPHRNLTSVDTDFSPLLRYIWENGLLSGALYMGQLEFGTEVMHAGEETTFEAWDYKLRITRDGDPDAPPKPTTTTTTSSATPTASSTSTSRISSSTTVSTTNGATTPSATDTSGATSTANAASCVSPFGKGYGSTGIMFIALSAGILLLTTSYTLIDTA